MAITCGYFCANCCCVIGIVGILFYACCIGFINNRNLYLLAVGKEKHYSTQFALAMLVHPSHSST